MTPNSQTTGSSSEPSHRGVPRHRLIRHPLRPTCTGCHVYGWSRFEDWVRYSIYRITWRYFAHRPYVVCNPMTTHAEAVCCVGHALNGGFENLFLGERSGNVFAWGQVHPGYVVNADYVQPHFCRCPVVPHEPKEEYMHTSVTSFTLVSVASFATSYVADMLDYPTTQPVKLRPPPKPKRLKPVDPKIGKRKIEVD